MAKKELIVALGLLLAIPVWAKSPCTHERGYAHSAKEPSLKIPYRISGERERRLIANYSKLQLGMTESEVENLLGVPDRAQEGGAKERPECLLTQWNYYLAVDKDFSNTNNKLISIAFGKNGRLYHAEPANLPELSEKGSIKRQKR